MYGDAVCYDWQQAKKIWSYSFNPEIQPEMAGGPTVIDNIMYVGGSDSFLRAFNIETQKEVWRRRVKGSLETPLVISQDLVFAVTPRGRVYAVDRKTGEIRWQYESNGSFIASPVIVDNSIIFANNDDKVYRFGPLTSLP
jgi:outer membrane protein assembly factor BamB